MQILSPQERAAAERRVGEIRLELKSLSKEPETDESKRTEELNRELEELNRKLTGIGPPIA